MGLLSLALSSKGGEGTSPASLFRNFVVMTLGKTLGGGPGGPGGFFRPSAPEVEAIEAKASSTELKALIAEVKAGRAKRQAELEKAQQGTSADSEHAPGGCGRQP
jgi:hypothetical protein